MAYEIKQPTTNTKPRATVTQLLNSNATKVLAQNLCLTQQQIQKANSAALALSTNPTLRNCEPTSIIKFVYEVARNNFTRDDCVYPVPYNNTIQAQVGYKGFREKAMQSGKYLDINCTKVYSCDKIKRDINTGKPYVEFETDYNKTKNASTIGYYAYAISKETREICNSLYWTKAECETHGKAYSKTYNTLWGRDERSFDKMAMKTVIKQLCNELDSTPLLEELKKQDGYVYGEGYSDNPRNSTNKLSEVDNAFNEILEQEEIIDNEPLEEEKAKE